MVNHPADSVPEESVPVKLKSVPYCCKSSVFNRRIQIISPAPSFFAVSTVNESCRACADATKYRLESVSGFFGRFRLNDGVVLSIQATSCRGILSSGSSRETRDDARLRERSRRFGDRPGLRFLLS